MLNEPLAEKIADRLRRSILRGQLRPGAQVKERDIAADMGASRTPVREAIRILAKEGLAELRPSRSPIIAIADVVEFAEKTEVLIALEKLAARLACTNASNAQIARIAKLVRHMDEHFDTADTLDMFEVDMAFHSAIAEASCNSALAETQGTFLRQLWRVRYVTTLRRRNRERVVGEHSQILEAIKRRDAAAAEDAIDKHLSHLADDIRDTLEQEAAELATGDT